MSLLPWNNPLVGTAFMLRARRGNMMINVTLYIILLVMGYVGWQYYLAMNPQIMANPATAFKPNNVFLRILFGVQCFLSGIVMLGQAGGSLKNEVMNKTLDFQRIAALGPWEILLGKLFGLPVMAYLLAMAALPVAVYVVASGGTGITPVELVLIWIQLLTFLFLLGSCAIQNTLQINSAKGSGAAPGFGIFMACVGLLIYSSFAVADSVSYLMDPRRMTIGALFSPLTAYAGITAENPWAANFYWFSFKIPCLFLTPIAHIIVAWFFLSIMARRLANLENTPLGKWKTYLFLFLADLIAAGVLNSCRSTGFVLGAAGLSLQQQIGTFLLVHGVLTVVFFVTLTPKADGVMAWLWRFRGEHSFVRDSLLHDRAPNTMSIVVNLLFAAMGVGLICLTSDQIFTTPSFLLEASLTSIVTIVTLGLLYQFFLLASRKYGSFLLIILVFMAGIMPVFAGALMRRPGMHELNELGEWLLMSTPFSQAIHWVNSDIDKVFKDINPYPMIVAYTIISVVVLLMTFRWLNNRANRVQKTKARLLSGRPAPAMSGEPGLAVTG